MKTDTKKIIFSPFLHGNNSVYKIADNSVGYAIRASITIRQSKYMSFKYIYIYVYNICIYIDFSICLKQTSAYI